MFALNRRKWITICRNEMESFKWRCYNMLYESDIVSDFIKLLCFHLHTLLGKGEWKSIFMYVRNSRPAYPYTLNNWWEYSQIPTIFLSHFVRLVFFPFFISAAAVLSKQIKFTIHFFPILKCQPTCDNLGLLFCPVG